ncbi:Part of AAA domain-containing protein [Rhodococcus maanshanensis]|uniref:Part of AAA domain-containing protein n=1 Tax=Rhodococcus maanshanensis TaxID=183556 RepID=A0A1H7PMD6_9NOCA|nr:Part of AAA domain-containing protein [Rhodococcus maanshanensis]
MTGIANDERVGVDENALPAAVAHRLERQLTSWREKLLALDRRQRLLYFKHTKSGSLEIGHPGAEVLLAMVSAGEVPVRPQPADGEELLARSIIVTNKTADTLKTGLGRLDQQSQQSYADRGVWTLHLGLGMLRWVDPSDGAEVDSPILMVPVQLKKTGSDSPYVLFRAEDDITVNPALKLKMEDCGVTLPDVDPDVPDLLALTEGITHAIRGHAGWSIVDRIVCTAFTFHKEAIYRDLLANAQAVASHPMVQLLAVGPDAPSAGEFAFDPLPVERLDHAYPPEKMYSILDADSSQRGCILAASDGRSFVMDGPPGTGKSQTIANMIAELISSGKTVLFVSEKAAALDVVRDRLSVAGLQQFLFELHSHAATRKQVVQELSKTLHTRVSATRAFTEGDAGRLVRTREELSAFAEAMNETRTPLGMSVFEVVGRLERLPEHVDASADPGARWTGLDATKLVVLREHATRLGGLWHVAERGDDFLWRGLERGDLGAPEAREFKRTANRGAEVASALGVRLDTVDAATGLRLPRNADGIARRSSLLRLLEAPFEVPVVWFSRPSLTPARTRLEEARSAVRNIDERSRNLERLAGQRWDDLDEGWLDALAAGAKDPLLTGAAVPGTVDELQRRLREVPTQLGPILADAVQLADLLGVPSTSMTAARAGELAELAALGAVVERPEGHWLNAALQNQIAESIDAMDKMVDHARRRQDAMREHFTPAALELDIGSLALRFRDVHKGFGKFSKSAREDRKALRAVTVTGKVDKALIARLEEAASWQHAVQELGVGEQSHAPKLGASYQGLATDFASLRLALDNARRAANLAGIDVDGARLTRQLANGGAPDPALVLVAQRLGPAVEQWTRFASSFSEHLDGAAARNRSIEELTGWALGAVERLTPVRDSLGQICLVAQREVRLSDAISLIKDARSVRESRAQLQAAAVGDQELFGDIELGMSTDFDFVARQLEWAEDVRASVGVPIRPAAAAKLGFVTIPAAELDDVNRNWETVRDELLGHFSTGRHTELAVDLNDDIDAAAELLAEMEQSAVPDIENWCEFTRLREWAHQQGFGDVLAELAKDRRSPEAVGQSLEYAALESWVDEAVRTDSRLQGYNADNRDTAVAEFKDLDRALVADAHARVIDMCNARAPKSLTSKPAQVITREAQKKTRHKPVRQLMEEAGSLVQELKPCFMMSPLSVSQYLPPTVRFDVVIFDEASQVLPSDAVNCVYRGSQLIVAGDQKQLPPTDFFAVSDDAADEEDDEVDVFQSVLDLAKGAGGLTSLPLNWHYRSRHEDLITYSNYRFYDGKLFTFPSAVFDAPNLGVELFRVNGTYRRGTTRDNPAEAVKVVERVRYFAESHPEESIGVVTFSTAQADAVMAEMERQSEAHPRLAALLGDHDRLDGFFVKSLENVQGDERDVIVFSLGYGPDENGKFTMNFGPLNREGGWRRLNVAITRARKRVEVVSSFRAAEMSATTNEGVRHLKNYLDFAERGQKALALDLEESLGDVESPFEEQVIDRIRSWGYEVVPQVGVAGYRIDMAVRHPDRPGSYAIGIECDGAAYHSSKTARDRDRLREAVLRNLGWEIHRIWGLSWWRDRDVQEKRLREAIENAISAEDRVAARSPERAIERPQIEVKDFDFDAKPEWATEYTMVGEARGWHRDPKTAEGQQDLRAYFVQVIEAEAPVHRDVVYERFKQEWGIQRLGAVLKRSADSSLAAANIRGRSVAPGADGVCRLPDRPAPVVRVPVDGQPLRKMTHIPEEELDLAVAHLIKDAHSMDADTLAQQVARLFGWQRATEDIRFTVELAVERLVGAGDVARAEDGELSIVFE